IVELAPPPKRAEDLDARVVFDQVLSQEAPCHPGYAGDQDAHNFSSRTLSRQYSNVSRSIMCRGIRGCHPVSAVNLWMLASWRGMSDCRSRPGSTRICEGT